MMSGEGAARIADKKAFIERETRISHPPHVREIALHLADALVPLWRATEDDLAALGLAPPFWAFAWAGGQGLARYVLDNAALVAGRRVLDFGAGSGLVAIAAAKAGAGAVTASDLDPFAIAAIGLNAALNRVAVNADAADYSQRSAEDLRAAFDVILAGDICYDRDDSVRFFDMLQAFVALGGAALVGDPGRSYLPKSGLTELALYRVETTTEIEDFAIKSTRVWRVTART